MVCAILSVGSANKRSLAALEKRQRVSSLLPVLDVGNGLGHSRRPREASAITALSVNTCKRIEQTNNTEEYKQKKQQPQATKKNVASKDHKILINNTDQNFNHNQGENKIPSP